MNGAANTVPQPPCTAVSAGPDSLKQCSCCGSVYTHTEFFNLPTFHEWRIEGEWIGFAQCSGCFSSITVPLGAAPESVQP